MPPPGGLATRQPAAERLDPVGQAAQPGACAGVGAAHPVVGDLDDRIAVAPGSTRTVTAEAPGVLGHVRQRLRRHEVRGELDRPRQRGPGSTTSRRAPPSAGPAPRARGPGPARARPGGCRGPARAARPGTGASSSLALATSCSASPGSSRIRRWISESCRASVTSRCWAPSCRLRSMRRRSASAAVTMRSPGGLQLGEPGVGLRPAAAGSPARSSPRRRRPRSAPGRRRATGRRPARRPPRRRAAPRSPIGPDVGPGSSTGAPAASTKTAVRHRVGDRERRVVEHPGQRGLQLRRAASSRSPPNRSASPPRASRDRSSPARNASGTVTSEQAVIHSSERATAVPAHDEVDGQQRRPEQQAERAGHARQHRPPARRRDAAATGRRRRRPCRPRSRGRAPAARCRPRSASPGSGTS